MGFHASAKEVLVGTHHYCAVVAGGFNCVGRGIGCGAVYLHVSLIKIRNYLIGGNIDLANKLLSRTWSIEGYVKSGNKIGRKLGYRTCNIKIKNYIIPKPGIYAVKVSVGDKVKVHGGVAYLGTRPTFAGKEIFLEVNIFNFNKNLYKKKLKVYFLKFLRVDKKFANSAQLVRQMNKDVIFAKKELKTKLIL